MDRKLAAILALDIVGYSSAMERDESGTFARLMEYQGEIFEPEIKTHHGYAFKFLGDGLLAEFGSLVEAVNCAVAIQRSIAERNRDRPVDQCMEVRIGVTLGDVIVEGQDRYGEGVNIAARLQQLGKPGEICVSRTVVDQLAGKIPVTFEATGRHQLKNIAKPVDTYRVKFDGAPPTPRDKAPSPFAQPARAAAFTVAGLVIVVIIGILVWLTPWTSTPEPAGPAKATMSDPRPSLAVLPFDSLSDDKDQAYVADGITEDLTTALARVNGLFVVSHNSANEHRDQSSSVVRIAGELGVRYLLQGSIRRAGGTMRINAQLIDATTGAHIWAERFDGAWADIFTLQDEVVGKVTSALQLRLVEGARLAETPGATRNPDAYNLYLQGIELSYATETAQAAAFFRQAIALDPTFGQAWAELGWVYWTVIGDPTGEAALGFDNENVAVGELKELLQLARKYPSTNYLQLMASIRLYQRKPEEAIPLAQQAIAFDPSDHWAYEQASRALVYDGRTDDAVVYLDAMRRVDPQPSAFGLMLTGLVAFARGSYEDAVSSLERVNVQAISASNRRQRLFLLVASHGHLGNAAQAAAAMAELRAIDQANLLRALNDLPFKLQAHVDSLVAGLAKGGLTALPFDLKWKDRLTGPEIASLILGQRIGGHDAETGDEYQRTTSMDGTAQMSVGPVSRRGVSRVDGDLLCTLWDTSLGTTCAAILRNSTGTAAEQDEYLFVVPDQKITFSVEQ